MALFNCCFYQAEYLSEFNAVHILFKGKVASGEAKKLGDVLRSLSESLKIEKLILDFTECEEIFIDYNSHRHIAFWKNLEDHGLKVILLIMPPKNFKSDAQSSWKSFYTNNNLAIEVSAISDRKQMPLFMLNEYSINQTHQ